MPFNAVGLPLEYIYRKKGLQPRDEGTILWRPKDPEATAISRYRQHVNSKYSLRLQDSHELHKWSVSKPHDFWISLYQYTNIIPPLPPKTKLAYNDTMKMADIPPFFPGHKLNFAENVLVPNLKKNPNAIAITGLREGKLNDQEHVTWTELWELVRKTRSALVHRGIKEHDVVAVLMSNSIWTIVVFLATASIGAYFTSISPDMGASGCISRLSQVKPKMLFAESDFALRGARHGLRDKIEQINQHLTRASLPLPLTILVPTEKTPHQQDHLSFGMPSGTSLKKFLESGSSSDQLTFTRLPPSHPMFILYSSGTTGNPKCILSPHISVLNFKKVAILHNSLSSSSVVFQYSSTSWVVWNIMVGHLSVGARLITYDGGALYPSPATLLQICEKYKVTYWGTSPRYLLELEQSSQAGANPRDYDLYCLRMVTTTGATLTGPQMRWFYTAFPSIIHLSSVAGGTEITSSWVASDPAGPLHENEMQMWALGHDCDIADGETGDSLISMQRRTTTSNDKVVGELVCRKPLASQPVGFWNDPGNKKYREAYFERFPLSVKEGQSSYLDVWAQHDITSYNPSTHGVQITARSDSTLNPSGIRFGPSEIYSILSAPNTTLKDKISDALCVGRKRQGKDKDEIVFLFLIAQNGHSIDDALIKQVRDEIGRGLSQRHIPKFIIGMPNDSIPYTVNGKKVEVIVKKIISGDVQIDQEGNIVGGKPGAAGAASTITNPKCLSLYAKYKDIERATSQRAKL